MGFDKALLVLHLPLEVAVLGKLQNIMAENLYCLAWVAVTEYHKHGGSSKGLFIIVAVDKSKIKN